MKTMLEARIVAVKIQRPARLAHGTLVLPVRSKTSSHGEEAREITLLLKSE
jgi:hypothetical protein